jgi:hypothetical protein
MGQFITSCVQVRKKFSSNKSIPKCSHFTILKKMLIIGPINCNKKDVGENGVAENKKKTFLKNVRTSVAGCADSI